MEYDVRRALEEETEVLASFMTMQAMETEDKTLDPETIRAGVRGLFQRPQCGTYYVALHNEEIVAMMMIHHEMSLRMGGLIHWINSVYVMPAHRKQGVFTLLYNHVLKEAGNDVKCLRLYVDLDNTNA